MPRFECSKCGSPTVNHEVPIKALRRSGETVTMPYRCSNPDCVHFDPRRAVFGWAKEVPAEGQTEG